jgi:hypothetical protein
LRSVRYASYLYNLAPRFARTRLSWSPAASLLVHASFLALHVVCVAQVLFAQDLLGAIIAGEEYVHVIGSGVCAESTAANAQQLDVCGS